MKHILLYQDRNNENRRFTKVFYSRKQLDEYLRKYISVYDERLEQDLYRSRRGNLQVVVNHRVKGTLKKVR